LKTMRYVDESRLAAAVLGRTESFFAEDLESGRQTIVEALRGASVLVIGAGGSIGSAFVRELCEFSMEALHLVDVSENNLVELVRGLRASGKQLPEDFRTFALDFCGREMHALLGAYSYEYVLNFAALKHVRSERDPFTLMRLLQVNVVGNDVLLDELRGMRSLKRVFCVSSDKAVRPASLMGASKAFMERVFLTKPDAAGFSSARFANVAFSEGSLLSGFLKRLAKGQPLSAPSDVRRYFITAREAGQLCVLACFTGRDREIYYPELCESRDMMTFSEIAKIILREHGLRALECGSDREAIERMKSRDPASDEWPCHFSRSDTSGEKMFEEFVDPAEKTDSGRFRSIGVVCEPLEHGREPVAEALGRIRNCQATSGWTKEELVEAVGIAVPELEHVETGRNLDQKM